MIVVDTSVWIDYFNGRPTPQTAELSRIADTEDILVGDLVLIEVLQGYRSDLDFHRAKQLLGEFEFGEMGGYGVALASARNYRALRARGVTVRKTIDVIIATFCILNGHRLLHSDRDFDPIEHHLGLQVIRA